MSIPSNVKFELSNPNASTIITRVEILRKISAEVSGAQWEAWGGDRAIYLSTHPITRNAVVATENGDPSTYEIIHYKPILLKSPNIKSSVDHENRNFRIPNVTLSISNYEYDGARFSDIFESSSLINEQTDIYWDTPSSKSNDDSFLVFRGYIKKVTHTDETVNIVLEDLSNLKLQKKLPKSRVGSSILMAPENRNAPIPITYGQIEAAPTIQDLHYVIRADTNTTVSLNSDLNEIPTWGNISPIMAGVDDRYVYILEESEEHIAADNDGIIDTLEAYHLQYTDDLSQFGGISLLPYHLDDSVDSARAVQSYAPSKPSELLLQYRSDYESSGYVDSHITFGDGWGTGSGSFGYYNPDRIGENFLSTVTDDVYDLYSMDSLELQNHNFSYDVENWATGTAEEWGSRYVFQNIFQFSIAADPSFSHLGTSDSFYMAINKVILPKFHLANWTTQDPLDHAMFYITKVDQWDTWRAILEDRSTYSEYDNLTIDLYGDSTQFGGDWHQNSVGDIFGVRDIGQLFHWPNSDEEIPQSGISIIDAYGYQIGGNDDHESLFPYIQFAQGRTHTGYVHMNVGYLFRFGTGDSGAYYDEQVWKAKCGATMAGNISEIDSLYLANIEVNETTKFFLSLNGRTKQPYIPFGIPDIEIYAYDADGNQILLPQWQPYTMTNPIEILRNIYQEELGVEDENIDEESYERALSVHSGMKFGFSVNKEIEAKKLVENIAKSTLCYPHFNSQGKLSFASLLSDDTSIWNYYLDLYEAGEERNTINNNDIINFSFEKTKSEKVYTKVDFHYKFDYLSEKYTKILDDDNIFSSMTTPELERYGYESIEDNILKFECPYVRDDATARKVREWLFSFNKHQHLICKLNLNVSYSHLNVGDFISFKELISGMKAFGLNYISGTWIESSGVYEGESVETSTFFAPLFFITSINKKTDSVYIEAQQVHSLRNSEYIELFVEEESEDEWSVPDDEDDDIYIPPEDESANDTVLMASSDTYVDYTRWYDFYINSDNQTQATDILHWFLLPQTWGFESFDELIPDDYPSYETCNQYDAFGIQFNYYEWDGQGNPDGGHGLNAVRTIEFGLINVSGANPEHPFGDWADVNFQWVPGEWISQAMGGGGDNYVFHPFLPPGIVYGEDPITTYIGHEDFENSEYNIFREDRNYIICDINGRPWQAFDEYPGQTMLQYGEGLIGQFEFGSKLPPSARRCSVRYGRKVKKLIDFYAGGSLFDWEWRIFYAGIDIEVTQIHPGIGDVNWDTTQSVLDVIVMINSILGGAPWPFPESVIAADVNNDGLNNVLDVVQLVNILLGND